MLTNFITRQLSFTSERNRGVRQWRSSNLSRGGTQWHGWELYPQPPSYKCRLSPHFSHILLKMSTRILGDAWKTLRKKNWRVGISAASSLLERLKFYDCTASTCASNREAWMNDRVGCDKLLSPKKGECGRRVGGSKMSQRNNSEMAGILKVDQMKARIRSDDTECRWYRNTGASQQQFNRPNAARAPGLIPHYTPASRARIFELLIGTPLSVYPKGCRLKTIGKIERYFHAQFTIYHFIRRCNGVANLQNKNLPPK